MAQTAVVKRDEEPLEMLARLFRQAQAQADQKAPKVKEEEVRA